MCEKFHFREESAVCDIRDLIHSPSTFAVCFDESCSHRSDVVLSLPENNGQGYFNGQRQKSMKQPAAYVVDNEVGW